MNAQAQVKATAFEKPPSKRLSAVRSLSNFSQRVVQRVSSNLRSGIADANDYENSGSESKSQPESESENGVNSAISFFERVAREVGLGAPKQSSKQRPRASYSAPTSTIHTPCSSPHLSPLPSSPVSQSPDLTVPCSLTRLLEHHDTGEINDAEIKPSSTSGVPRLSDPTRPDFVPLRHNMVASHSDPHLPRLRMGSEGDFRLRRGSKVQLGGSVPVEGVPRSGSLPFWKKGKSPSRETVTNMNGVIVEKERQGSFDATSSPTLSPGHSRSGSGSGPNSPTFQSLKDNFWPSSLRRTSNRTIMESQSLDSLGLTPASFALSSKGGERVGMSDLRAAESEEESYRVRDRENRLASPSQSPVLGKWVNRSEVMQNERTQMIGALSRPDRGEEVGQEGDIDDG
eukprot:comp6729_c0_seq1/m.2506 comp6729_c0_seq1/g.2506  ORF comp6729_c0_seq1/g.2506 comp6729_c0_seq1/m.2506 type:complete len:400 (-) comp6729_c0_seq1:377-1576(-)